MLGPEVIAWLIDLTESDIFKQGYSWNSTDLTLEEQLALTVANYKKINPSALTTLYPVLHPSNFDYPNFTSKIQEVDNLSSSSYTHSFDVAPCPFIIVDPTEAPWILNHECEHAHLRLNGLTPHLLYGELAPILTEPFFLERLYEQNGTINPRDYQLRLDDIGESLDAIYNYFVLISIFKNEDFDVTTEHFEEILREYGYIEDQKPQTHHLTSCIGIDVDTTLKYLLSSLRAIEVYEETKENPSITNPFRIIMPELTSQRFRYTPPKEGTKVYQKYMDRMDSLVK